MYAYNIQSREARQIARKERSTGLQAEVEVIRTCIGWRRMQRRPVLPKGLWGSTGFRELGGGPWGSRPPQASERDSAGLAGGPGEEAVFQPCAVPACMRCSLRSGRPPLRPRMTKLPGVLRRSATDLGCLAWVTRHELLSKSLGLTFRAVTGDVKHHLELEPWAVFPDGRGVRMEQEQVDLVGLPKPGGHTAEFTFPSCKPAGALSDVQLQQPGNGASWPLPAIRAEPWGRGLGSPPGKRSSSMTPPVRGDRPMIRCVGIGGAVNRSAGKMDGGCAGGGGQAADPDGCLGQRRLRRASPAAARGDRARHVPATVRRRLVLVWTAVGRLRPAVGYQAVHRPGLPLRPLSRPRRTPSRVPAAGPGASPAPTTCT